MRTIKELAKTFNNGDATELDRLQALILSYRNTLQTTAQMRRAQANFRKAKDSKTLQACLLEAKRLETAVDMRLSQLEIKAIGD